jgi:formylmethanofuran dehydrogenase subunit B
MAPPASPHRFLPFCGLPCPEARLAFEGDRVVGVEGACPFCREAAVAPRDTGARAAGQDVPLEEALTRAADLLARARRPFLFGLAASPVGTARRAARLAAQLDAAIDFEGGALLEAELGAIAATGQMTATFGEMRAAADLVVLWRVDPRATHPDFLPAALDDGARRFVVVPPRSGHGPGAATPAAGDLVVPVPHGRDLEALRRLRGLLHGAPSGAGDTSPETGPLRAAAGAIAAARRVAILWDAGLAAEGPEGTALAGGFALLTLAARPPWIAAKAIGPPGNVAGAMAGLLAATGHPRAVGFAVGAPRRDPDRFGSTRMLGGGADLVLAFEPLQPSPAIPCPTILIGSRRAAVGAEPEVFLPVAPAALSGEGLFLRADGVPLPRSAPGSATALPSEAEVIAALLDRLRVAA